MPINYRHKFYKHICHQISTNFNSFFWAHIRNRFSVIILVINIFAIPLNWGFMRNDIKNEQIFLNCFFNSINTKLLKPFEDIFFHLL
jgi:hypothetical protein